MSGAVWDTAGGATQGVNSLGWDQLGIKSKKKEKEKKKFRLDRLSEGQISETFRNIVASSRHFILPG